MKNMHRRSFLKISTAAAAAPLFSIGGTVATGNAIKARFEAEANTKLSSDTALATRSNSIEKS